MQSRHMQSHTATIKGSKRSTTAPTADSSTSPTQPDACSICLGPLHEHTDDVLLISQDLLILNCSHTYHNNCIQQWLLHNGECPLCRKRVNTSMASFMQATAPAPTAPTPTATSSSAPTAPTSSSAHKCPKCKKSFLRGSQLRSHIDENHRCRFCGGIYINRFHKLRHENGPPGHPDKIRCPMNPRKKKSSKKNNPKA